MPTPLTGGVSSPLKQPTTAALVFAGMRVGTFVELSHLSSAVEWRVDEGLTKRVGSLLAEVGETVCPTVTASPSAAAAEDANVSSIPTPATATALRPRPFQSIRRRSRPGAGSG